MGTMRIDVLNFEGIGVKALLEEGDGVEIARFVFVF
jgi:hypothetical protein